MSEAIGKRAIACKHWRWMPGMLWWLDGKSGRMVGNDPSGTLLSFGFPDLSDPATLGCLLALVREAWGDPGALVCRRNPSAWECDGRHNQDQRHRGDLFRFSGHTEAEALVAALEAAEGREVSDEVS